MKIIFASKFYYHRAGLESYLFRTKALLERCGHSVIPFSTNYHQNYETEYSKYFCKYYELSESGKSKNSFKDNILAIANMCFNIEAYRNMKRLIKETKPDILQGFGITKHLSYSIFKAAKDLSIPTIMRLSDYALLCPNTSALDGFEEICADFACSKPNNLKILKKKCIHGSFTASLVGKFESTCNMILKTYKKNIDCFISPSKFLREVFIKYYGLSPEKIIYLPVFLDCTNIQCSDTDEGYFLFAGRMSREKGIMTLLKALNKGSKVPLILAGRGPKEEEFKEYAYKHHLNTRFLGFQDFQNLQNLIKNCRAVILPSEWHENSPNIVLEAYAYGKPVIGSYIGGIPELVSENETGLTFQAGNADDLNEKIEYLHARPDIAKVMGKNAKVFLEKELNPEKHYQRLMEIYNIVAKY